MEARDIFDLILKADDALKYATEDKLPARSRQARDLLERARDEARRIGNEGLVAQAEQRLADLQGLLGTESKEGGD
jgi:hypothetical protein